MYTYIYVYTYSYICVYIYIYIYIYTYIFTPGQKYKTTLKNEGKDIVYHFKIILSVRSDFHMTDSLSIARHAFVSRVLMSVLVDEALLPR